MDRKYIDAGIMKNREAFEKANVAVRKKHLLHGAAKELVVEPET